MNVPPKAFKLKSPANAQASLPAENPSPVAPQAVHASPPQMNPQSQPKPQSATQPQHGNVSQGKLLVHNRASIVPPSTAPQQPVAHAPLLKLRPALTGNPEGPANEISRKPVPEPLNVKPALQKTSVYDVPEKYQIPDMSEDLQKILENESENFKDQLQGFVDLCEILSKPGWQFADIADYIHMLVRTVNMDVMSIVLTDPSEKGKLCKVINRGYKSAPGPQIIAEWQSVVSGDATVNWNKLMDMAADKNTRLCRWICREDLQSVGYVPLHGGTKIYGFLFVGAREDKMQSPLASSLLELCGDRIGVVLETRRGVGALPATADGTIKIIKDQLSLLAGYMETLKTPAKSSPEDMLATVEKCLKTISESKKTIDLFANK